MGDVENMTGEQATNEQRSRGPAVNEVRLLGRLAADPNVRYTPEGKAVTELRVATNERPEAEFHDLVAYGRLAEVLGEVQDQEQSQPRVTRLHGDDAFPVR